MFNPVWLPECAVIAVVHDVRRAVVVIVIDAAACLTRYGFPSVL